MNYWELAALIVGAGTIGAVVTTVIFAGVVAVGAVTVIGAARFATVVLVGACTGSTTIILVGTTWAATVDGLAKLVDLTLQLLQLLLNVVTARSDGRWAGARAALAEYTVTGATPLSLSLATSVLALRPGKGAD